MGPHISRITKERKLLTKGTPTIHESAPSATVKSAESADLPAIKFVTSLASIDFTREYHGVENSDYFLPSDVDEQDRLELQ
ncbi:hypothetical protein HK100_000897, partial [Physocladia obscura]